MCGISGSVYFGNAPANAAALLNNSLRCMVARGPDDEGVFQHATTWLGHRRLSIIDVSPNAHQPFTDANGRYTLVFNGEIFNFRELKKQLTLDGVTFRSESDTEVLLHLLIREGTECLKKLNGFFSFAFYDKEEQTTLLVRDRFGVKPLYYYKDERRFLFASETGALTAMDIPMHVDTVTLHLYLQLNYVPGPWSMLKGVKQLMPGHYAVIDALSGISSICKWYNLPEEPASALPYPEACRQLYQKMEASVRRRLIADVPLGAFLSGGVDSSIITALAAKETSGLHTFSIGFADEPHFDETHFARKVAAHCGTVHREFRLSTNDLMAALPAVMDYFGEPFADSSALAVYILSRETRKHATVALSGDGSDELFAGYKKHRAEWLMRNYGWLGALSQIASPVLGKIKGSRQHRAGNIIRQLHRFAEGSKITEAERYWRWCSIASFGQASALLQDVHDVEHSQARIAHLTAGIKGNDYNELLRADVQMVLPNDMLVKADLMSMANSLEVRTPFLDVEVAELALSLPAHYKIDRHSQKKILKDTFGKLLPPEIFSRRKQGFEVPLLRWLRNDLALMLKEYTSPALLRKQGLFRPEGIQQLLHQLNSDHPGEAASRIWALLVFQHWWLKNFKQDA